MKVTSTGSNPALCYNCVVSPKIKRDVGMVNVDMLQLVVLRVHFFSNLAMIVHSHVLMFSTN